MYDRLKIIKMLPYTRPDYYAEEKVNSSLVIKQ